MFRRYPIPWRLIGQLTLAILRGEQRSFKLDARSAIGRLHPALEILGLPQLPGPCVITPNHFSHPGFYAWWLAFGVSAALEAEVHWIVTSAWRYDDWLRSVTITPLSSWLLKQISGVYDFTRMPPMPPRPDEAPLRAQAVREILRYARQAACPVIGLAPEGGDFSSPRQVAELPSGSGRLLLHLAGLGLSVLPVGVYEGDNRLFLNFGLPYRLDQPQLGDRKAVDAWVRQVVRNKIEELLEQ